MNKDKLNKKLSVCGIMLGISLILINAMRIVPFNTLFLLLLLSFIMCVIVQKTGVLYGLLSFIATSIMMFFILPDLGLSIGYVFIFGAWPIVKYLVESKIRSDKALLSVKIIYFILVSAIVAYLFGMLIGSVDLFGKLHLEGIVFTVVVFVVLNILLWLYEIVLSCIISFFSKKFTGFWL